MKLIRRHKGLAIITLLTLVLVVILFAIFSRMLFSTGKSEYGDRLNGIIEVSKDTLADVKAKINENDEVENATVRIQGKIIYTTIIVSNGTSKDKAKEIATKTLEEYEEDVIDCYDFEFIISEKELEKTDSDDDDDDEEDKTYTIAGTKHPDNDHISWTK